MRKSILIVACLLGNNVFANGLKCLEDNIIYEARGEGLKGMMVVASVTMNRAFDNFYPDDICSVVYQPKQFSWTHEPQQKLKPEEKHAIKTAKIVARMYITGVYKDITEGALWYYDKDLNKEWARGKEVVMIHRNHIVFRGGR